LRYHEPDGNGQETALTAERDWDDDFNQIDAGYQRDTAVCKNGGHQIHKAPDGGWVGDDGDPVCPVTADGALHDPVRMPRQGRSGAR
jgi:hypothetical protein